MPEQSGDIEVGITSRPVHTFPMRELLIIQTSPLGDIVHSLRLVAALRAQQPDWRVSWIVQDIFAPLVRASTVVDQILVFRRFGGVGSFLALMKEVRQRKYDVVLDLQGLLRSGLMLKWARAHRKIGRSDPREWAGWLYEEKAPLPPGGPQSHLMDILLQFCPLLNARPELAAPLQFRSMEQLNLGFMQPLRGLQPVLLFPDSRRERTKWGGFAPLTALLIREMGRKVVWAGSKYLPCRESLPDGTFVNLTGNTSLVSLTALINRADWVISNDSGAMHLATALGVKTIGIFGPTDSQRYGPYPLNSPTNHVIKAPLGDLHLLAVKDVLERFRRIEAVSRGGTYQSVAPFAR